MFCKAMSWRLRWGWGNPLGKLHRQGLQLFQSSGWQAPEPPNRCSIQRTGARAHLGRPLGRATTALFQRSAGRHDARSTMYCVRSVVKHRRWCDGCSAGFRYMLSAVLRTSWKVSGNCVWRGYSAAHQALSPGSQPSVLLPEHVLIRMWRRLRWEGLHNET